MKRDQLAYLQIWKWCLFSEILILATLGFAMSFWCGFAALIAWAVSNLLFYREVIRQAKTMRLIVFGLTFAFLNSLVFVLSGIIPIVLKYWFAGGHFEKAIKSASGIWPQFFLMIFLFATFDKALIFTIARGVQKIIAGRVDKSA